MPKISALPRITSREQLTANDLIVVNDGNVTKLFQLRFFQIEAEPDTKIPQVLKDLIRKTTSTGQQERD